MIQLISPMDPHHPHHKEIMDLYFYMAARTLPFYPEDIFPEDTFYWQDREWKIEEFYNSYSTPSVKRGEISESIQKNRKKAREDRAKRAKDVIKKHAKPLYDFLYIKGREDEHVIKENLYELLCGSMDCNAWETWKNTYGFFTIVNSATSKSNQELQHIFDYNKFIDLSIDEMNGKKAEKMVHLLIKLMDLRVCPYCNRNYITTYKVGRQSQIDHYRPKSQYPYFAISLLNLIPSCAPCNRDKGDKSPGLYPYKEGFGNKVHFVTKIEKGVNYLIGGKDSEGDFRIEIQAEKCDNEFVKRLKNSEDAFHLSQVYQWNKSHVAGIFRQRYCFGKEYLEDITKAMGTDWLRPEEILYNHRLGEKYWGEEPLVFHFLIK